MSEVKAKRAKSSSNDSRKAIANEAAAAMETQPARFRRSPRLCLSCGLTFASQWCGNRLCSRCASPDRDKTNRTAVELRA